jgi:N-formylglutamate deformylase
MTDVYVFSPGTIPLLVSIPHDGRALMPGQARDMTETGRALPDTDWNVRKLYSFARELGASVIAAHYSRYVIDLNRPADDRALYAGQLSTGLCPLQTFDGDNLYVDDYVLSIEERERRTRSYWEPYHERIRTTLDEMREAFGYALLWDAHSIRSEVPSLFDGGLPDLNIGTTDGSSCDPRISDSILAVAEAASYSSVLNGRFRGGYITRHYGDPDQGVHAIQLELAQKTYMDESSGEFDEDLADRVRGTLRGMLTAFTDAARALN